MKRRNKLNMVCTMGCVGLLSLILGSPHSTATSINTPTPYIVGDGGSYIISAYTSSSYTLEEPISQEILKDNKDKFKVSSKNLYTSDVLNVRVKPDKESEKIGTLNIGTKVKVIASNKKWCKIKYKNGVAYVASDYLQKEQPLVKISSTAYYNPCGNISASSRPLKQGKSLAGKITWLGRKCNLYKCKKDGTVGKYLGTYSFDDTGYGQNAGYGKSKVRPDKSGIGTIENGTCIDIYMDTYDSCINYGRKDVYIEWLD